LPSEIRTNFAGVRSLHTTTPRRQEAKDAVKEKPSEKKPAEEEAKSTAEEESKSGEEKTDDKDGKKKEKKEDLPPPPPHGDKSPWQVFTETLQTELKSSKEWNESTKQLADRTHQFTESESVKKAREAYERSTGAVASTTAKVVKTTAGAVAKGAGAVWETPVVKGVRATANATGRVIEKSTRPIRETEAFQSVKNVIDDGSSSRYGGWVEKEERRKARERREAEEALKHGRVPGTKQEVPVENPEYVYIPTTDS
jgi:import inner membrane translocase subunit TIM44